MIHHAPPAAVCQRRVFERFGRQAAGIRIEARPEDLLASLDAAVLAAEGISLRQERKLLYRVVGGTSSEVRAFSCCKSSGEIR